MPRKGYDITGCAPGSPASEAAARARQRTAPGNRTPRAGTPANPSHPDGDEQETPRASRIGISTGNGRDDSPTYSQMAVLQDDRGFQIQRRLPRHELYQNPLNMSSIQATSHFMARPISASYGHGVSLEAQSSMFPGIAAPASTGQGVEFVNAPAQVGAANFQTAEFGAQQQQFWNNGQFHALPASQHGIQSRAIAHPGPESFVRNQTRTNAGTSASQSADGDTEMTGIDS